MRIEKYVDSRTRSERLDDWFDESFVNVVWLMLGVFVAIAVAVVFFMFAFSPGTCSERTQGIGFDSRWSLRGGCQIEVELDTWIPLSNWRWEDSTH